MDISLLSNELDGERNYKMQYGVLGKGHSPLNPLCPLPKTKKIKFSFLLEKI